MKRFVLIVVWLSCSIACVPQKKVETAPTLITPLYLTGTYWEIDNRLDPDSDIEAFLVPWREQLMAEMNTVIGEALVDMTKDRGEESLLGNFVADVILKTVSQYGEVDCAITNRGGLRSSIYKGPIKIETMFNLMPFENRLAILEFTGKDFKILIEEIVRKGGTPLSGINIVSSDGVVEAYIKDDKIGEHRNYRVATIDYIADGGGNLEEMRRGKLVKHINILLREALIAYVKEKKEIAPEIEGRMVIQ